MARKRPRPKMIVLPNGERLYLSIMRVEERHPDGTPKTLTMLREKEVTDLRTQSNEFITAFVPDVNFGNGGDG